ncbi:MAG TPA: AMP-binding protein, partial [Gemmatimonadales bacterium]|nr:AMP-binding protein [Gemmatimonadales bacterium]
MTHPIWLPSPDRVARANLTRFIARYRPGASYADLWRWSVDHPEQFWPAVWEFCGVVAESRPGHDPWEAVLEGGEHMAPPLGGAGPQWFRGARLNFAENLLRHGGNREAIVFWDERGRQRALTFAELRREVERFAAALHAVGVRSGDRVAGWLPNTPDTVVAMLATACLGAIWSSCSPDFGDRAVLDRFGQIRPRVLFVVDGYRYGGKAIPLADRVRALAAALPDTERVIVIPHLDGDAARQLSDAMAHATLLEDWLGTVRSAPLAPIRLPFDHPLCIVFSSGTTG